LAVALSCPFKKDRGALLFSTIKAIDGVMSLALWLQVESQAPQHLRSFEPQAAFPRLSVRMVIHFPSLRRIQGSTSTGVFEGGCRTSTQASLGFPFHFSLPNTSKQPLFAVSTQMS